jgi:acetylxylan esterase
MRSFNLLATLATCAFTTASPRYATDGLQLSQAQAGCAPIHIIVARASTEAKGYGVTGTLARAVEKDIPGTTSEPIDYPAVLSPYFQSEAAGVRETKKQLTAYVKRCPQTKMILMGYSQGADVVGSVLCGGGFQQTQDPIDPEVGKHGKDA